MTDERKLFPGNTDEFQPWGEQSPKTDELLGVVHDLLSVIADGANDADRRAIIFTCVNHMTDAISELSDTKEQADALIAQIAGELRGSDTEVREVMREG